MAEVRVPRGRAWCFTINNYSPAQENYFANEFPDGKTTYVIVGKEVAPSTGTRHLQGYFSFKHGTERNVAQKLITKDGLYPAGRLVKAKGSGIENQIYCRKEGEILLDAGIPTTIRGTGGHIDATAINPKGQSQMILAVDRAIKNGATEGELRENPDHTVMLYRFRNGINEAKEFYNRKKDKPDPEVFVLWGKTWCGKSHWVMDNFTRNPEYTYMVSPGDTRTWWNGYVGQPCIWFDDFEPHHLSKNAIKRILDKYGYSVEPKNAMTPIISKYIVFTSNTNPETWYRDERIGDVNDDMHYGAIQRRLGTVMNFKTPFVAGQANWDCGFLPHRPSYLPAAEPPPTISESEAGVAYHEPVFEREAVTQVMDSDDERDFLEGLERSAQEASGTRPLKRSRTLVIPSPSDIEEEEEEDLIESGEKRGKPRQRLARRPRARCRFVLDEAEGSGDDEDAPEEEEDY